MTRHPGGHRRTRAGQGGQSIVEFVLMLPVFLVILMGMLEFGIAYDHRNAMAYAVREGARVAASLGNGGTNPAAVDPAILAAVQRGLTNPILIENIASIEIYKADTAGRPVPGKVSKYDRAGVLIGTAGWPATSRVAGLNGDSVGVRVVYNFRPTTPLGSVLGWIAASEPPYTTIQMTDATVMKVEPTT